MSGGNWDYRNDILCGEIFGYCIENTKEARRANPLEDVLISGLVFDVFKLLHAYDWYTCGDTGESDYREAVSAFKDKYLKTNDGYGKGIVKKIVDEQICETKEELYKAFSVDPDEPVRHYIDVDPDAPVEDYYADSWNGDWTG